MQKVVLLTLFFISASGLFAQEQIVTTATAFITHNQFKEADHYLDSILLVNPKTVDALMMKGNVLLNQAWDNSLKSHFDTEKAESIFDSSVIDMSFFTPIVPLDTSVKIDKLWNECLQIDPKRTDIEKGLCSLYSLSLRTVELERQLIKMQSLITENEDNAYLFAEYARNLKNRGRFDDAMQIYGLIAGMFPDLAGIRCDMANEYFYAGNFRKALQYLDSTMSEKEIDQTSYINAAALYSNIGYYDQAYNVFKKYSEKDTLLEGDFYKGLLMFANMDSGFYGQLHRFLDHATEQSYADEVHLAQKLLPFGRTEFTIDDYMSLAKDEKIPRYYRVLILLRGIRQFKDDCEPALLLGDFYCSIKKYSATIKLLEPMMPLKVPDCKYSTTGEQDKGVLTYSFALYNEGDKAGACSYFQGLFDAKDNFTQQAAKYFVAKTDWDTGKKESAEKLFEEVASAKVQTKYSWLSKGYLDR